MGSEPHSAPCFRSRGAGFCGYFFGSAGRRWVSTAVIIFFFISLFTGIFAYWNDANVLAGDYFFRSTTVTSTPAPSPKESPVESPVAVKVEFPLNCSIWNVTCPANYPVTFEIKESYAVVCPEYTRWIHEDLRPWRRTGITRDMVERGKDLADFRLVILKGKAYVERYRRSFQTRDLFTIWGILQLLRLYPGKIPDLDLMFTCGDMPLIRKRDYQGPNATQPPPLFHYCADDETLDIVFPDWSFWGWAEINIRPWPSASEALKEGNTRIKWVDRGPYAYWKGNPRVSGLRGALMWCNPSDKYDWKARLYRQDWTAETRSGFRNSKLEDQCFHKYKIYIEGRAWSVSEKYILACDSMTLLVMPKYYDFFTRSLVPLKHYWPIRATNLCKDIKFAVDWGDNHTDKAQAIGEAASRFVQEDLRMEFVYDFMFHSLTEYAKLLRYQPTIPPGAVEACSETMACPEKGLVHEFMEESMVRSPKDTLPCTLPPPYDLPDLETLVLRRYNEDTWDSAE
ncbi:hypothetical protein CJ030_MR7G012135 [Morella rubra]|uniref:Glycosyl transferase CAP10 domain-containing protein n=1 Tax=Morella rubra TaxID=262757 RepID=A0A6A1UXY5_9ROSI|nr:hypothetical protein CJ030_MR7G012135 [Morella rubra]